ncbi:unnamed protein product [Rotaria socialis]|uniref:Uncharacterized protein n=1 Tax=Rotaria socialis TaxID=392032 RepID=A0A818GR93_9BILA|nr:unnamed protein product [Rotaria socialis]CAF4846312.1 unnamed protein product [Rotaria socialis]
MAESKVLLETVIKHLSDTLTQQSTMITRLEQTMGSILSEVDTRITTYRAETQQEIKSLETTITSKYTMLTQVFDNIQSLSAGLHELKALFTNHQTLQSPTLGHPLLNNPIANPTTPIQVTPPSFINTSTAIPYERSYGQQSPFSTEQNDTTVSDSFWPVGIESWHIHEIKPQRECFTRKTLSVKLMITQFTDSEPQPKHPEDYCELETHILSDELVHPIGYFDDEQPQSTVAPESNLLKSDELIPHDSDKSPQSLPIVLLIDDRRLVLVKAPKTRNIKRAQKLPNDLNQQISDAQLHQSLNCSSFSTRMMSYIYSSNRLLRTFSKCIDFLSLSLFSILIRIGIIYDLTYYFTNDHVQSSTLDSTLTSSTIFTTCANRDLNKVVPYVKTMDILRNLESLLIYALP